MIYYAFDNTTKKYFSTKGTTESSTRTIVNLKPISLKISITVKPFNIRVVVIRSPITDALNSSVSGVAPSGFFRTLITNLPAYAVNGETIVVKPST